MSITSPGESIRARLESIQVDIEQREATLKMVKDDMKNLQAERTALRKALQAIEAITGGQEANGHAPAATTSSSARQVEYDELVSAVQGIGKPATSKEVADALGTTPVMIARKLKKLADDGRIGGDKESGFFALPSA